MPLYQLFISAGLFLTKENRTYLKVLVKGTSPEQGHHSQTFGNGHISLPQRVWGKHRSIQRTEVL